MTVAKPLGMLALLGAVFLALSALSGSARTIGGSAAAMASTNDTGTGDGGAGITSAEPPASLPPLPPLDVIAEPIAGAEPVLNLVVDPVTTTAGPSDAAPWGVPYGHNDLKLEVIPQPPPDPQPLLLPDAFEIA